MNCEICEWWKDYNDRVYACISTDCRRNRIELRRCKYIPAPGIESHLYIYTDSNYVCSGWRKIETHL